MHRDVSRAHTAYRFKTDHSIISHDRSHVSAAINIGNEIDNFIRSFSSSISIHLRHTVVARNLKHDEEHMHLQKRSWCCSFCDGMDHQDYLCQSVTLPVPEIPIVEPH